MTKQRIGILGCGWLGLPLGRYLVECGYSVNGSTRQEDKLPVIREAGIQAFQIALHPGLEGRRLKAFFDVDTLVITLPPGRRNAVTTQSFSTRVQNVATAARNAGVKQLLFTSSTSVYGDRNGRISETDSLKPGTPSALALAEAEYFLQHRSGLPSTILRLGGLVGPDRHPGRWLAGKTDLPQGNQVVNLVHLEDVIEIIAKIIADAPSSAIYNLCTDEHPTRSMFYTTAARALELAPPVFAPTNTNRPTGKIVNNTKIKAQLHYTFRHPNPMEFPEVVATSWEE